MPYMLWILENDLSSDGSLQILNQPSFVSKVVCLLNFKLPTFITNMRQLTPILLYKVDDVNLRTISHIFSIDT